jgi:hypothetical protein
MLRKTEILAEILKKKKKNALYSFKKHYFYWEYLPQVEYHLGVFRLMFMTSLKMTDRRAVGNLKQCYGLHKKIVNFT